MSYGFRAFALRWSVLRRNLRFFVCAICLICGFIFFPCKSFAMGEAAKFTFAQLEYSGGNWNPRPNAGKRLMWELIKRTSVEARIDTVILRADDITIFEYPFLYMSGDQEFPPFSDKEISNLKEVDAAMAAAGLVPTAGHDFLLEQFFVEYRAANVP